MTSSGKWSWRWPVVAVFAATALWPVALSLLAGTAAVQHVSNLGLAGIALAAGVTAVRRGRAEAGVARRFWLLLGSGVLCWALGQAVWTGYESVLGREVPFPSWADVGYLGLPPLAAAALLSLPLASPTLAGRVRAILDGLIVASSLLLCSWLLVLGPLLEGDDAVLAQAIALAYPLGDVVVITMVLYTGLRARQQRATLPVSLPLVGSGLVAFAVSDSGFTVLTDAGLYSSGSPIDVGWFVGFALVLLAALRQRPARPRTPAPAASGAPSGSLLPYTAVSVALATSVVEFLRSGHSGEFSFWVRTTIMALLVARQVLTMRENASLTRHLEQRVEDRTAQLQASQQRFSALVQHSSDLVMVVDATGMVTYQSRSAERVLGYGADALVGRSVLELMDAPRAADFLAALRATPADRDRVHTVRTTWRHGAGHACQVEVTVTDLLDNPDVGGLVLNARDVTDRVVLEGELTRQAFIDALTGLPNRALFRDRLEDALRLRPAGGLPLTVFFLDLDGFKAVNDTLGHGAGDALLVDVAERLRSVVQPEDTVARFGGDEFAVLLTGHRPGYAARLARAIVEHVGEPFRIGTEEVFVAVSIGIAELDDADLGAEQLLRNADLAMYQAKAAADASVSVYHPDMHAGLVERVRLEADLRRALDHGQLYLDYQPIVAMDTGRITGVEALVRWRHPERGVVPPADFIPLAEATGLIRDIGLWVLREACGQAAQWSTDVPGSTPLRMNVNLSGQQLLQPDLLDLVAEVLAETLLPPERLTLEMTESVLIDNSDRTLTVLVALRALGIRLSLDDFGTGYSSLSYLHRFPIDTLKIDRSFVERLSSGADAALVDTILALAASLDMDTVAEGIETAEQSGLLQRRGCVLGQGFHFSPPTTPAAIAAMLLAQTEQSAASGPAARGALTPAAAGRPAGVAGGPSTGDRLPAARRLSREVGMSRELAGALTAPLR